MVSDPSWTHRQPHVASATRCQVRSPAGTVSASNCDEAGPGLALLRGLGMTDPVWTARAVRNVNGRYEPATRQTIATAWY